MRRKWPLIIGLFSAIILVSIVFFLSIIYISAKYANAQAIKEKAEDEARKIRIQATIAARMKSISPQDHLIFIKTTLDESKSKFNRGKFQESRRRLEYIPTNTKERLSAETYFKQLESLEKVHNDRQAKALEKQLITSGIGARKEFARTVENLLLDRRINADVETIGPNAETLKIKWALVSKVAARDFSKGDVVSTAESLGFKKIILTNGFEYSNETYTWDLSKNH